MWPSHLVRSVLICLTLFVLASCADRTKEQKAIYNAAIAAVLNDLSKENAAPATIFVQVPTDNVSIVFPAVNGFMFGNECCFGNAGNVIDKNSKEKGVILTLFCPQIAQTKAYETVIIATNKARPCVYRYTLEKRGNLWVTKERQMETNSNSNYPEL